MSRRTLRMTLGAFALVATTWLVTAAVLTQDGPPAQSLHGVVQSTALGESRDYYVHRPAGYDDDPQRRYPVAYVLDAGPQFTAMVDASAILARLGLVPELIVVGVQSPDDAARQRDFTPPGMRLDIDIADSPPGEADRFLAFLRDELIPEIERRHRTTDTRLLSGHSRGGLFVVHSLLAEPGLFSGRFAHSPALWRDDLMMVDRLRVQLPELQDAGFLFLSLGGDENDKMRAGYDDAVRALSEYAPTSLRWTQVVNAHADHADNASISMPLALRDFFSAATTTH